MFQYPRSWSMKDGCTNSTEAGAPPWIDGSKLSRLYNSMSSQDPIPSHLQDIAHVSGQPPLLHLSGKVLTCHLQRLRINPRCFFRMGLYLRRFQHCRSRSFLLPHFWAEMKNVVLSLKEEEHLQQSFCGTFSLHLLAKVVHSLSV